MASVPTSENSGDEANEQTEDMPPLRRLLLLLEDVANGASLAPVVAALPEIVPTSLVEAREFSDAVIRLHQAAERIEAEVKEIAWNRK